MEEHEGVEFGDRPPERPELRLTDLAGFLFVEEAGTALTPRTPAPVRSLDKACDPQFP
jgi:hypothetical protein